MGRINENILFRYWRANYARNGSCTLCNNWGVIDTRDMANGRVNFCLCPNGQSLKKLEADPVGTANGGNRYERILAGSKGK